MIDAITKKRVELIVGEDSPAMLIVPESQLEQVRAILDANGVRYWVDEELLSTDDEPYVAFLYISRNSDFGLVQRLLDSVP